MTDVQAILDRYPPDCRPLRIEPLGAAGGLSGAQFWRISAPRGEFVLRRWPKEHPTPDGLRFIQKVLRHAAEHGITIVPVSVTARDGESFVEQAGYLWELAPWMPGTADYERSPSPAKLRAAMTALAEFHLAVSDFSIAPVAATGHRAAGVVAGPSPAIAQRFDQLRTLSQDGIGKLSQSLRSDTWTELIPLAHQFVAVLLMAVPIAIEQLEPLVDVPLPLQPCLRDIWHDHVLFVGDRVTGLVDFGAMQIETPAGDVARLLGSLVGDDPKGRRIGLAAYTAVRPLSPAELQAVAALDASGTVLSGANWLHWIYVEGRRFENRQQVIERFCNILERANRLPPISPRSGNIF